jgi:hypothetical protein
VLDFHGWYNCTYGDAKLGGYFASAFNASYAGKPSKYCFVSGTGAMDCGPTLGGTFHRNTTISKDLFAEWATSQRRIPSVLVEFPAPDYDNNGRFDTVPDRALGFDRMAPATLDKMVGRARVAMNALFAGY